MKPYLPLLQTLAAIYQEQSFEAAASKLCMTQSAVSQRLKQLETQLGQTLLIRSTPIQLTDSGHSALRYYQQAKLLEDEFLNSLQNIQSEHSILNIGVNADSLATWLFDALDPLLTERNVLLDIKIDDQDKTRELMTVGEVLGCISSDDIPIKGCSCFALGTMRYRCLATPDFKEKYFKDRSTKQAQREALINAPAIQFNHKDDLQKLYMETFYDTPDFGIKHRIPSTESYLDLISRGHGWGMVPDIQSETLREQGTVIELIKGQFLDIPLYWHIWNLQTQLNQTLTQLIRNQASTSLLQS